MARHKNQRKGSASAHPNSILGMAQLSGDKKLSSWIVRRQREADVDLELLKRWARAGFVSIPGNLGPVDQDQEENGE